jgi:hypothetical protein
MGCLVNPSDGYVALLLYPSYGLMSIIELLAGWVKRSVPISPQDVVNSYINV